MKKLALLFLLTLFATPGISFAQDLSVCETSLPGGFGSPVLHCACPNGYTFDEAPSFVSITSALQCKGLCQINLGDFIYDPDSQINSYSLGCIDKNDSSAMLTVAQGPIGNNLSPDLCDGGPDRAFCSCPTYGTITRILEEFEKVSTADECKQTCLNYKANNPNKDITDAVLQCNIGGNITTVHKQSLTEPSPSISEQLDFLNPSIGVEIPGFDPKLSDSFFSDGDVVKSNLLGRYIKAVYQWLLVAGSILAIVMIMIGGVQYMVARGNAGAIGEAKQRIGNAILGLAILFAAYTIAFWIDPATVQFKTLEVKVISKQEIPPNGEHEIDETNISQGSKNAGSLVRPEDINIIDNGHRVAQKVFDHLIPAAAELKKETGKRLLITSGVRTTQRQLELYYDKCISGGQTTCSPAVCNPTRPKTKRTEIINKARNENWSRDQFVAVSNPLANPDTCPHTAFAAIDVWCEDGNFGDYTFDTECQAKLTTILEKNEFCRLSIEAWHFELDSIKASVSSCSRSQNEWSYKNKNTGKICNFQSCERWGGKTNRCIFPSQSGEDECNIK